MNNIDEIKNEDIVEGVLAEFSRLAEIPRPSGHEKAVSDYLYKLFSDMGCRVVQDGANNIIADMEATAGCAGKPLTILQAHMDMVCVAAEGVEFNPLTDAIRLVREGNLLHADGTSLGADDGMGIAIIVYIMKTLASHGPLRAVITVDEECGMTGAENLAAEVFADAEYLINCDSEDWDLLTVGSAGSGDITFRKNFCPMRSGLQRLYRLKVSGLKGGHSGEEINCGGGNAVKAAAACLNLWRRKGLAFDLVSLNGGRAKNVIPSAAEAVFFCNAAQEALQKEADEARQEFLSVYGSTEAAASFAVEAVAAEERPQAMDRYQKDSLLDLLMCLSSGVSAMSQLCPGLVQTSANLGVVRTVNEAGRNGRYIEVQYMPRSAAEGAIGEYYRTAEVLARLTDFELHAGRISPGWAERQDSRLAQLMLAVFEEQNGWPMRMATIHAGLECSWHLQKNPRLDIVSIGTSNNDIHSPQETLELDTVAPQVRLIAEVLGRI
ncbi:M20/M25/M40 family metallo-hydrolase [Anaerovibrio sp.]|uniref:M20/M25/M40 family metallo-hydrolase n=1 Tax=Anaerovibrio sp. TaxID=1872532 RepID=UPI003F134D05